jgi:hypothetical protein
MPKNIKLKKIYIFSIYRNHVHYYLYMMSIYIYSNKNIKETLIIYNILQFFILFNLSK